jgi:hypothetical protein
LSSFFGHEDIPAGWRDSDVSIDGPNVFQSMVSQALFQQINPCQIVEQISMESGMKIYVGNLSPETTESQLRESFVKFGEVASLAIVTDKESGKSRGFAFVEMSSEEHAQAAIAGLHGQDMGGSLLKVNEAKKR